MTEDKFRKDDEFRTKNTDQEVTDDEVENESDGDENGGVIQGNHTARTVVDWILYTTARTLHVVDMSHNDQGCEK